MEPVAQRGGAATKLGDNLNDEMVSLSAVTTSDVTWLAEALARHHAETGSALAARLLDEWPATVSRFRRVTPRDAARRPLPEWDDHESEPAPTDTELEPLEKEFA